MYEFIDADGKFVQVLGIADFKADYDAQVANGSAAKTATRLA